MSLDGAAMPSRSCAGHAQRRLRAARVQRAVDERQHFLAHAVRLLEMRVARENERRHTDVDVLRAARPPARGCRRSRSRGRHESATSRPWFGPTIRSSKCCVLPGAARTGVSRRPTPTIRRARRSRRASRRPPSRTSAATRPTPAPRSRAPDVDAHAEAQVALGVLAVKRAARRIDHFLLFRERFAPAQVHVAVLRGNRERGVARAGR